MAGRSKSIHPWSRTTPTIVSGVLTLTPNIPGSKPIYMATPEWSEWLKLGQSFYYFAGEHSFNVTPQRRRRGIFWYALKRITGKLRRIYIGDAESITYTRLREIAEQFKSMSAAAGE